MARAQTVNRPRGGKRSASRVDAAVGYVRRSTDRQEQSIPDQKRAIEQYCEGNDLRLLRFYTDDAISGTSTIGRKSFQALMDDASHTRCDFAHIVVYDIKRFGRIDNDEAGYYRHILRSHDVQIVYVSEHFTGDGTDDLLRPVKQWQAREESKDLSKVAIRGLLSKSDSGGGWWMGGAPPFGYDLAYESQAGEFLFHLRYMRDGSKQMFDQQQNRTRILERNETVAVSRRDRCKLMPSDEQRVQIVQRIFRMYVEDRRGFKGIADALNRDGVPTSRSKQWASHYSGKWSTTSVRSILLNPAYCGDLVWNRHTDGRFHRIANGRAVERQGVVRRRLAPNDEQDWIVISDAHPPIVSRRVFESARDLMKQKKASKQQRGINPRTGLVAGEQSTMNGWTGVRARFMLSSLCTCAHCGHRYEGYTRYTKKRDEHGNRAKTYHYACGGYIRHGRSVCTLNAVSQELLEERFIKAAVEFYSRYNGDNGQALIAAAIEAQIGHDREQSAQQQQKLKAKLNSIDSTTRRVLDNISEANADTANRRVAELSDERDQIESKLESLQNQVLADQDIEMLVHDVRTYCNGLELMLRSVHLDERQIAARRCVESIEIDRANTTATLGLRIVPTTVLGQYGATTATISISLDS